MRIVFVGASKISMAAARLLSAQKHEVILIDRNKAKIEELRETLDCGFLQGDGTKPDLLKEVNPEQCDFLICTTGSDQYNLIIGLIGQTLGFKKVISRIDDESFEHVCKKLGLNNLIIPSRTIGRFIADSVMGHEGLQYSGILKGEARFFTFITKEEDGETIKDLALPKGAKAICIYRNLEFILPDEDTKIQKDDEVVLITHSSNIDALKEKWGGTQ